MEAKHTANAAKYLPTEINDVDVAFGGQAQVPRVAAAAWTLLRNDLHKPA